MCSSIFLIALVSVLGTALGLSNTVNNYSGQKLVQFTATPLLTPLLDEMDVWSQNETTYQVRVNQEQLTKIENQKVMVKVLVEDLAVMIDENSASTRSTSADWFSAYHTYSEIMTWYSNLAKANSKIMKFVPSIGTSVEKRNIAAVHITNPNGATKKKIWFEALIHAREWITGSTLQYVLNYIVQNSNKDPRIKAILDKAEIIAIPVLNVDGYSYTWTNERLWRKNRHVVNGGIGIDLNRNFPYKWGVANGASKNPRSETYQGPSPGSEPETQAVIKYFESQGVIAGAIDFHSYSQLILRPYGTTKTNSPDEALLNTLGADMASKIDAVAGKRYINEKTIDLYPASGTASDWFYNTGRKTYSYTIELSPSSNASNGFVLPPSQIVPVGQDIIPAVLTFIETVLAKPLGK